MRAILLLAICLTACGNVTRPLTYSSVDDPVWRLTPMPAGGGNAFTSQPVAAAGRIKNGL